LLVDVGESTGLAAGIRIAGASGVGLPVAADCRRARFRRRLFWFYGFSVPTATM
jgi:hypothetical protein